jgi:membrane protease YdiL (CAAX protease family)
LIVVVVAGGCALLAARPALFHAGVSTSAVVGLFVALLAVSVVLGRSESTPAPRRVVALALALGVVAFALGRLIGGGHAPQPLTLRVVALNTLAAVAEEAFFRRLVFGALARDSGNAGVAVAGSAVLFAAVHLTIYGAWVLPLDLAAGLVLGWQRWVSGSWSVPAATHVVANALVVI